MGNRGPRVKEVEIIFLGGGYDILEIQRHYWLVAREEGTFVGLARVS